MTLAWADQTIRIGRGVWTGSPARPPGMDLEQWARRQRKIRAYRRAKAKKLRRQR